MKNLSRNELKKVMGGVLEDCPAYENCNGVSGDVYCCTGGSAAGTTGSCNCLHKAGCTFVTNTSSNCPSPA